MIERERTMRLLWTIGAMFTYGYTFDMAVAITMTVWEHIIFFFYVCFLWPMVLGLELGGAFL